MAKHVCSATTSTNLFCVYAHTNLLKHILVWVCLFILFSSHLSGCEPICLWVCLHVCVCVQYHFPAPFLVNVGWWRQSTKLSNGELILALPPSLCAFHLLLTLAHSHPSQPISYPASATFLSISVQLIHKKLKANLSMQVCARACSFALWDYTFQQVYRIITFSLKAKDGVPLGFIQDDYSFIHYNCLLLLYLKTFLLLLLRCWIELSSSQL